MIDVIVSSHCVHCTTQKEIMDKNFFDDEFRIIDAGSKEFADYDMADKIDVVPFIVIKNKDNEVVYAKAGVHQEDKLRKIALSDSPDKRVFNLRKERDMRLDQP